MKQIQKQIDEWVQQYKVPYWKPHEILARLMEEVGELAREVNHRYGPKKKKPTENTKEIGEELGDVIFTIACFANSLGIDCDAAFEKTMAKSYSRDKDRWERK